MDISQHQFIATACTFILLPQYFQHFYIKITSSQNIPSFKLKFTSSPNIPELKLRYRYIKYQVSFNALPKVHFKE